MSDYGVTETGFIYKPYTVIYTNLSDGMKIAFGSDLDTSIDTPNGQLIGLFAADVAELWQQENAIYDAYNPNAAFGVSLTNIGVLTYTPRQTQSRTVVPVVITGDVGTYLPAAVVRISTEGVAHQFHFLTDITIPISGEITTQAEADDYGPIIAPAGTLNVINTPITGWTSVINLVDATPGRNTDTDPGFRLRRNASTASASQNTEDALAAALRAVNGVTDAIVLVNDLNEPDINGFAPHSITVVVEGGEDIEVAQTIYGRKTSSIPTNGDTQIAVSNNAGFPILIKFFRQEIVPIYIRIEVVELPGFPVDGLLQIQQNVYDYLVGTNNGEIPVFNIGNTIIISKLYTPINLTPSVSVTQIFLDTEFPPTNTLDLLMAFNQLPEFTLDNIQVVGT